MCLWYAYDLFDCPQHQNISTRDFVGFICSCLQVILDWGEVAGSLCSDNDQSLHQLSWKGNETLGKVALHPCLENEPEPPRCPLVQQCPLLKSFCGSKEEGVSVEQRDKLETPGGE